MRSLSRTAGPPALHEAVRRSRTRHAPRDDFLTRSVMSTQGRCKSLRSPLRAEPFDLPAGDRTETVLVGNRARATRAFSASVRRVGPLRHEHRPGRGRSRETRPGTLRPRGSRPASRRRTSVGSRTRPISRRITSGACRLRVVPPAHCGSRSAGGVEFDSFGLIDIRSHATGR